ncbi:MAG: DUF2922 domain-containing protein [Lysinibacillus sp.]|nr:DUF2922 domain-containing protein [Lysinibacillus sp.]
MKFDTANGKVFTISLNNPKDNLTPLEVSNAMQTIIEQDVFHNEGAALESIKQARIIDKNITEIL